MLKILYWTCRGPANTPTIGGLNHLVFSHSPDLVLISEPMTSFSSFKSLSLCNFDFDTFHSNSSPSHSGNLWCFCKSSLPFSISVSDFSSQHLSMLLLNSATGLPILITGIYGSTNQSQRKALWNTLINHSSINFPCCVLGDFNAILSHDE